VVTLDTVQKKKTMKKESGFKLKSGNKPSPAKMFGGALSVLGRRRKSGGAVGMIGGALGQAMGRRRARGGSPNMAARVASALAGATGRNMPGKPASPRTGLMGAIQPIAAGAAIARGGRSGGSRRRRRSMFGGLFRRR
jgi:hypothetical protein